MFDLYNEIIVFFAIKNNTLNLEYQYAYENKHILMYFKVMCTLAYKEFFYSQVHLSSHTIYSELNSEQIIVNTLFTQIIFFKIINYYDHFSIPNDIQFYIYLCLYYFIYFK